MIDIVNNIKQNIEKKQQQEQQQQTEETIEHSTYIYDPHSNTYKKAIIKKQKTERIKVNYLKLVNLIKKLQHKQLEHFYEFLTARDFRNELKNIIIHQKVERISNFESFKKAIKEIFSSKEVFYDAIMNKKYKNLYKYIIIYSIEKEQYKETLKAVIFTAEEDKYFIANSYLQKTTYEVVKNES